MRHSHQRGEGQIWHPMRELQGSDATMHMKWLWWQNNRSDTLGNTKDHEEDKGAWTIAQK